MEDSDHFYNQQHFIVSFMCYARSILFCVMSIFNQVVNLHALLFTQAQSPREWTLRTQHEKRMHFIISNDNIYKKSF